MHNHNARIQSYMLIIKEQYETIRATLLHTAPGKSSPKLRAHAYAYTALLMELNERMRMHDTLMTAMQAYVETFLADSDASATREPDVANTDALPPSISIDDEWMFQYEIDKAAEGEYADDAFSYDDDGDDGEDDEADTVPLTADQAYVQRLNQLRPLVLEPGLVSGQPAEDFAVELSDQQFRQLFGLDGSTLKRPMNAVEALGVFGFVFSAEEKQRLLAHDEDTQAATVAGSENNTTMGGDGEDNVTTDDGNDDDGPDYNIPGVA
jgi:hypothetical protein